MTDERVIDRIRRMRERAADEATTEHESVFLAERIQRTLEEHGLTEADIGEASDYATDERLVKYLDGWRRLLAGYCGKFVGVDLSWRGEWMSYHGRPLLCKSAWELFLHLERSVIVVCRGRYRGQEKLARRAFKGVAIGLCERLEEIRTSLPESRLPVVQEYASARAWTEENINPRSVKNRTEIDSAEAAAGYILADSIEIQRRTQK